MITSYEALGKWENFLRKAGKVLGDPVLRRWAIEYLTNGTQTQLFTAHFPLYLKKFLPLFEEKPDCQFPAFSMEQSNDTCLLPLAGQRVEVTSDTINHLFEYSFKDPETFLSLHRFAWVSELGKDIDPFWVNRIWIAWQEHYGCAKDNLVWHPYTVAERAINILNFSQRYGLPGEREKSLATLVAHALAISNKLEYYGEHNTSNHLANNGRGLFYLGLFLGMPNCADLGGEILLFESNRIFLPSGILREGSTHYHALLTRNYAEAFQVAKAFKRREAPELYRIVEKGLKTIRSLTLPGRFPLFGDISPDRTPKMVLEELDASITEKLDDNTEDLKKDGWWRLDASDWSGLWHVPKMGWCQYPGHGHQDCGSFELHYLDIPIFVDPGKGEYGEGKEAKYYYSGLAHNLLMINSCDPYPNNKPYFSDLFRKKIVPICPEFAVSNSVARLTHYGFSRLRGVGATSRDWSFKQNLFTVSDQVEGNGKHYVIRNFCTSLDVKKSDGSLILFNNKISFRLSCDEKSVFNLQEGKCWNAYGEGVKATFIRVSCFAELPWYGEITVKKE